MRHPSHLFPNSNIRAVRSNFLGLFSPIDLCALPSSMETIHSDGVPLTA
jgi:hypothetical protein